MMLFLVLALQVAIASTLLTPAHPPSLSLPQNASDIFSPLQFTGEPRCHRIDGLIGLRPSNCELVAALLCNNLNETEQQGRRGEWIWKEMEGCATAYYFPKDIQKVPTDGSCELVLNHIIGTCAYNSSVNIGSINVGEMPSWDSEGRPEFEGIAMFLTAPERLTL